MKTTTKIEQQMNTKGGIIVTLIGRAWVFAIILSYFMNPVLAQNHTSKLTLGAGLFSQVSANGYGGQSLTMIHLKKGRYSFIGGPVIQNRQKRVSGVQFNYTYALTGPETGEHNECEPELFAFISTAYNYNALLGKRAMWEEKMSDPAVKETNISDYKFKSAEVYAGFGLKIVFFKKLKWISAVGVGGYKTFNFPDKCNLHYENHNIGLLLRTGISLDIF